MILSFIQMKVIAKSWWSSVLQCWMCTELVWRRSRSPLVPPARRRLVSWGILAIFIVVERHGSSGISSYRVSKTVWASKITARISPGEKSWVLTRVETGIDSRVNWSGEKSHRHLSLRILFVVQCRRSCKCQQDAGRDDCQGQSCFLKWEILYV